MADHIDSIADLGRHYFAPDRSFRSALNRSARSAAWRMIRDQEGVLDNAA
jgi:type I restriction enzyme R subunit